MNDTTRPQGGAQDQCQNERLERARAALRSGQFQIKRDGPQHWTVQNGDKLPYAVTLQGENWACTCPDYRQHGPDILCKHIEGVRLCEAAQIQSKAIDHKEQPMEKPQLSAPETPAGRLDRILWELRQPLDMTRVKRRQAPGTGTVPYLEGYDVIERANDLFGFAWSFDLLSDPFIVRWQKKILAWSQQEKRKVPVTDANGAVQCEEVGIVYITGKVSVALGDHTYSHADLGRCVFTGNTPEALDMALAGSATDCLKRCFRQLGEQFGLSLYDKEIAQTAGLENGHETTSPAHSVTPPVRPPVPAAPPPASAPLVRKYGDGTSVNGNVSEQEAFDSYKKAAGNVPASKDVLRAWLASLRLPATSVAA